MEINIEGYIYVGDIDNVKRKQVIDIFRYYETGDIRVNPIKFKTVGINGENDSRRHLYIGRGGSPEIRTKIVAITGYNGDIRTRKERRQELYQVISKNQAH